jgi:hypothetical protein
MKNLFLRKQRAQGHLETVFVWIIPLLIGVSRSEIAHSTRAYSLHLTPFVEIMFNLPVR